MHWTAPPGSLQCNSSGVCSTSTGTLGYSDALWGEADGTSNELEKPAAAYTGKGGPQRWWNDEQQIGDLLSGFYVFGPSTPSASSQGPGVSAFGPIQAWTDTVYVPNPLDPFGRWIPIPILEPQWSLLPSLSGH